MMMTAADMHRWLTAFPYPGATDLHLDELGCGFTVGGAVLRYDFDGWIVSGSDFDHNLPPPDEVSADRVHAEIARVLALVMGAGEPDALQDRLTDEIDRRKDVEAQLAKMTAARDALAAVLTWEGAEAIYPADLVERARRMAGDAAQHLVDREFVADAHDARARLAAYLGMDGAGLVQIVEAIERGRSAGEVVSLKLGLGKARTRIADLESELAGARDAADHLRRDLDFMNQRRANAQKRVTDLEKQRDEYQAAVEVQRTRANVNDTRAAKAEARVKRLLRQRRAAHAVLDEAGIGLEVEGSPRWTLARRCRAAVDPVWDHLDAVHALDEIAKVVGMKAPSLSDGPTDGEVIARVKALHQEGADLHRLRSSIAIGLGLDESASLSLILDAVNDDRDAHAALSEIASLCGVSLPATPAQTVEAVSALLADRDSLKGRLRGAEGSIETLSGLLDVLAAPVAFGERRLSPAERAEWALRRWLAEGRASDTRIAQLIEAEVYLDVRGVPAYAAVPGDDPGDASEALTLPERLRMHFGGHPDRQGRSSR